MLILIAAALQAAVTIAAALEPGGALDVLAHAGVPRDASLVLVDDPKPGRQTGVTLAGRVAAPPATLLALLADPAAYRAAIPSFERTDVLAQKGPDRLIAWELEVPLWNLKGKLWLRPRPQGVELDMVEGDFAPGLVSATARTQPDGALLVIEARANTREVNWFTRRLVARDPLMEPAMTAAAGWVLLRAFILEAERRSGTLGAGLKRRPTAAMRTMPLEALDLGALVELATDGLDDRTALALVRNRPDGRLERVEIAALAARAPEQITLELARAQTWRPLHGWGGVKARPAAKDRPAGHEHWEVDSSLALVDFDSVWDVTAGPPFRARSIAGDWVGATMGWDVFAARNPNAAVAVFSLHPRLDRSGYVPRKFIEAEPLLEHGLALGLAYVDAAALLRGLRRR